MNHRALLSTSRSMLLCEVPLRLAYFWDDPTQHEFYVGASDCVTEDRACAQNEAKRFIPAMDEI